MKPTQTQSALIHLSKKEKKKESGLRVIRSKLIQNKERTSTLEAVFWTQLDSFTSNWNLRNEWIGENLFIPVSCGFTSPEASHNMALKQYHWHIHYSHEGSHCLVDSSSSSGDSILHPLPHNSKSMLNTQVMINGQPPQANCLGSLENFLEVFSLDLKDSFNIEPKMNSYCLCSLYFEFIM